MSLKMGENVYGWFKTTCPKCGAEASAYGYVYTYRNDERAIKDEDLGGTQEGTSGETLSGHCDQCGHSWGPWVEAGNRLKAARVAAPVNARYWKNGYHWEYLWPEGKWIGTGITNVVPVVQVTVKGFVYGLEEGFDSSRFRTSVSG